MGYGGIDVFQLFAAGPDAAMLLLDCLEGTAAAALTTYIQWT